jgi:hypothetical protein
MNETTESPVVRAAMVQSNLDELVALGPDVSARVEARLGPTWLAEARGASRLGWVPVGTDVHLAETIDLALGRTAMREWSKQGMLRIARSPLLEPIARSAKAIFGLTPRGFLRRAPQIWSLLYRGCGAMTWAGADDEARVAVHLVGAPDEIMRSRPYLVALEGGIESAMSLACVEGTVRCDVRSGDEVVFECRW